MDIPRIKRPHLLIKHFPIDLPVPHARFLHARLRVFGPPPSGLGKISPRGPRGGSAVDLNAFLSNACRLPVLPGFLQKYRPLRFLYQPPCTPVKKLLMKLVKVWVSDTGNTFILSHKSLLLSTPSNIDRFLLTLASENANWLKEKRNPACSNGLFWSIFVYL